MSFAAICFTEYGYKLLCGIRKQFPEAEYYCKGNALKGVTDFVYVNESTGEWAGRQFKEKKPLVFVGACGIAVRAIAPYVNDKLSDSPVVVMDDAGKFVIPILSGHVGGANELARDLAEATGAVPVITTSTDIHGAFAVDMFAKLNGLNIINKNGIAYVSSKVLKGEKVVIDPGDYETESEPENIIISVENENPDVRIISGSAEGIDKESRCPLVLQSRDCIAGIGCRRGKTEAEIRSLLEKSLLKAGLDITQIFRIASIDIKKEEAGLNTLAESLNVPFMTFTADELKAVPGDFNESEFVRSITEVGNVCERAAMAACLGRGELILSKQAEDGVTVAIARADKKIIFTEKTK